MKTPFKVEGVDYTPDGVENLRQELIRFRDNSMEQWPEAIPFTVAMTHTIALLAYLKEVETNEEK